MRAMIVEGDRGREVHSATPLLSTKQIHHFVISVQQMHLAPPHPQSKVMIHFFVHLRRESGKVDLHPIRSTSCTVELLCALRLHFILFFLTHACVLEERVGWGVSIRGWCLVGCLPTAKSSCAHRSKHSEKTRIIAPSLR